MRARPTILLLLLASSVLQTEVLAQEVPLDTTHRQARNIFLVDVGSLVTRYLNFGGNTYYPLSPYMFGYRRILGRNAIRLDLGGTFSSANSTVNDSIERKDERNQYRIGLGYEHYFALGKRWLGYIGTEAYMDRSTLTYVNTYSSTDSREQRQESTEFGISALAGIAYRFTSRMQVATETSYSVGSVKSSTSDVSILYPQYNSQSSGRGTRGEFIPPTALIFRVLF